MLAPMKTITTCVYTFRDIIEGDFLYVDKTRWLYDLIKPAKGVYFLSRPRRFGKSLTLSTLESIFLGEKELFKGLYIHDQPLAWKKHPVIRLNLGDKQADTADVLKEKLSYAVRQNAARYGIELQENGCDTQFQELVLALSRQGKVVILVDEYDKPILGNIGNPELPKIRDALKAFYSVIKGVDEYLRFAFLTGVSKFSQVSIFSDLNNLTDLTMMEKFAELPGFTQQEVEDNYAEYIDQLSEKDAVARGETLAKIREWYNGYRFSKKDVTLYNPVSIGKLFENMDFKNYWFETGTPGFLLQLMKNVDFDVISVENLELDELGFSAYEIDHVRPEPILFQTGYITIKGYDNAFGLYTLGYPNREVENAFLRYLMDDFTPVSKEYAASHLAKLMKALLRGDMEMFFRHMRIFFENVPYDIQLSNEKYYQTIFYLVMNIIGVQIDTEVRTASGRIDAVVTTDNSVFIFEFKLQGSAEDAIAQIKEKRYHEKYLECGKRVRLIGAAFDKKTRNLETWVEEEG
ncbi:MAG: AAA family ATPase [Spartobacteria bacterium]|nr:AAA family ATPase [Spartobacteria bacterium]